MLHFERMKFDIIIYYISKDDELLKKMIYKILRTIYIFLNIFVRIDFFFAYNYYRNY